MYFSIATNIQSIPYFKKYFSFEDLLEGEIIQQRQLWCPGPNALVVHMKMFSQLKNKKTL